MCRFVGFVGTAEIPLSTALFDAPHSLQRQSYAPRMLLRGHVNVDGAGAAWWPAGEDTPSRYVTATSLWADPNLSQLAHRTRSRTFVAAVRSATPGIPHGPGHVQPFVSGRLAGVHNGWIEGFRGPAGQDLIGSLPTEAFAELTAMNDSQVLFHHMAAAWRDSVDLNKALRTGFDVVDRLAARHGGAATLNVMLSDGESIVASRHSRDFACNSLFTLTTDSGAWVASEPLDDEQDWVEVPAHHLATVTADGVELETI